jgi:ankyrin repeat protein
MLIKSGFDLNPATNAEFTSLMMAAQNDHADIVDLLIATGANVDDAWADATPLNVAAHFGRSDVVEMLIENGADDKASADGASSLHAAAHFGHSVEMLIENGADLNRVTQNGKTPAFAAMFGHRDAFAFDMFLGALGCDANRTDNYGWTAAHAAASKGHVAVLTSLLRAGCDVSTVKTKDGDTPLQFALRYNPFSAIELLATAAPTRALRGRSIALFSLVVAFLGSWALYQASWALYQARGAGARADAACLDLLRDSGSDQAVRRIRAAPSCETHRRAVAAALDDDQATAREEQAGGGASDDARGRRRRDDDNDDLGRAARSLDAEPHSPE